MVLGGISGTCWIWVSDVPFGKILVGSSTLMVLVTSCISGKWDIQVRQWWTELREEKVLNRLE